MEQNSAFILGQKKKKSKSQKIEIYVHLELQITTKITLEAEKLNVPCWGAGARMSTHWICSALHWGWWEVAAVGAFSKVKREGLGSHKKK